MFHLFYIALKSVSLISLYRFKTFLLKSIIAITSKSHNQNQKRKKGYKNIINCITICNAIESYCFKGFKDDMALK